MALQCFSFVEALAAVGFFRIATIFLKYKQVSGLVRGGGSLQPTESLVFQIRRSVTRASYFVPGATCLPQALAAQWMLRRRGYAAKVVVGVSRGSNAPVAAHAWVMSGNRIVIGGSRHELSRFNILLELGAN